MSKLAPKIFLWPPMLSDTSKVILYSLLDNYPLVPFGANVFIVLQYFFLYTDSSFTLAFLNLLLFFPNISFLPGIQKPNVLVCFLSPHTALECDCPYTSLKTIFSVMKISSSQVIHSMIWCLLGNHMVLPFLSILFYSHSSHFTSF